MKSCNNCIYEKGRCYNDDNMEFICKSADLKYWKQDENKPKYSFEVAKHLLFDIAMDLEYGNYKMLSDKSHEILDIIGEMDKMKVKE